MRKSLKGGMSVQSLEILGWVGRWEIDGEVLWCWCWFIDEGLEGFRRELVDGSEK